MINIEKYKTQSGAAKALAKALAKYAYSKPVVLSPKDNHAFGGGWAVMCEDGPYDWPCMITMPCNLYAEESGLSYNSEPQIKCVRNENWYTEPYNHYVLCFGEN